MASTWSPEFHHQDLEIMEAKPMYTGYCSVIRYQMRFRLFEGGNSHTVYRECLIRPPAVAVVLYDREADKVVMIEQLRAGLLQAKESPWMLEIVAGVIDEGETPIEAAHREAKEEAGCDIVLLEPVCSYLTSPGISNEIIHIYCGLIKAPETGRLHGIAEDGEDIKIHVFTAEETFALVKEGKIMSSPALIALQWLELNHASLRLSR